MPIDTSTFLQRVSDLLAPAAASAAPLSDGGLVAPNPTPVRPMTDALGADLRPLLAIASQSEGGFAQTCAALDAALRDGSLVFEEAPDETVRGSPFVYPVV
ncbi:hypothetical protein N9W17_02855 [Jannaschia sp.]|nr:hypothetical protein [Jannaschia sp.]